MAGPPSRLVVEGEDDYHVLGALLRRHRLRDCCVVESQEGVDRVLGELDATIRFTASGKLGIIVDADIGVAARWQRIRDVLRAVDYTNVPDQPDPMGTVIAAEGILPRFGAWMMPDNAAQGALEDFIAALIAPDDCLWPHAQETIRTLPERRFGESAAPKALMHTWLAWQEEPRLPYGLAITKRYLDGDHDKAQALMAWVQRLFVDP
jgi:hypothetical protein